MSDDGFRQHQDPARGLAPSCVDAVIGQHMPTTPSHLRRAIRADSLWYAHTDALRQRWFKAWLAQDEEG